MLYDLNEGTTIHSRVRTDHRTFTITDLCREFDVTPRTLRFYEAKGLLYPHRENSRRRFSARDRARLKLILRGKRFGFSLDEIRELLDLYDADETQLAQLTATLRRARGRLDQMQRQRDELTSAITDLTDQIGLVETMIAERAAPARPRTAN